MRVDEFGESRNARISTDNQTFYARNISLRSSTISMKFDTGYRTQTGVVSAFVLTAIICLSAFLSQRLLAQSRSTGRIVFTHGKPESNIYVINDDGTRLEQLTDTNKDSHPTWAPDGQLIAFATGRNFKGTNTFGQIYAMKPDGTNPYLLTNGPGDDMPTWSEDGQTIAFVRRNEIYLMNSNGSNQRLLTRGRLPTFSPDGMQIAFVSGSLYIISVDGTNRMQLHHASVPCICTLSWSPNGRWIAFTLLAGENQWEIFRIGSDGTNLMNLTNHPAFDAYPAWSLDSTRIAFSSSIPRREGGIFVMNADGSNIVQLTALGGFELDWQTAENLTPVNRQGKKSTTWGLLKMFAQ